jgi:hypothetical protein
VDRRALSELEAGRLPAELAELARRWVIVDLPRRYY